MENESNFPVRMFVYHYRIFDKYNRREVVSFAVLGDDNPDWRPQATATNGGMESFRFPVVKLLDYAANGRNWRPATALSPRWCSPTWTPRRPARGSSSGRTGSLRWSSG